MQRSHFFVSVVAVSAVAVSLTACGGSPQQAPSPEAKEALGGSALPATPGTSWLPEPDIEPDEAQRLASDGALILDVTPRKRRRRERLEGVTYIPVLELGSRMDEVPRGRTVIVLSESGRSSAEATRMLRDAGYYDIRHLGARGNWVARVE